MVGTSIPDQRRAILTWWGRGHGTEVDQLANAARCVNVLRSMGGEVSEHPELRAALDRLNSELARRWNPTMA
ncbi:hypothetical protein ACN27E_07575 [Mycobacterium sp. WMMD1722]|uniref:hypothetical protein n=1 Tax=Mycobacterium sp. WMMD1722 TaxID=3404117 RepID=UPI003BF58C7B